MARCAPDFHATIAMHEAFAEALERELLAEIPLARAMGLRLGACNTDSITLCAPLAPNVNDKGCAFGGSLASLLTLAGWALVVLHLRTAGEDCDVYIQDSQLSYRTPVWSDFDATAQVADGDSWAEFDAALMTRGKGRLRVTAVVRDAAGTDAVLAEARFVALRRAPQH